MSIYLHRIWKSNWCIRMLFSQALHSSLMWQLWSPNIFDVVMDKRQAIGFCRWLFRCRSTVVKWDCKELRIRENYSEGTESRKEYVVGSKYFRRSVKRRTSVREGWRTAVWKMGKHKELTWQNECWQEVQTLAVKIFAQLDEHKPSVSNAELWTARQ